MKRLVVVDGMTLLLSSDVTTSNRQYDEIMQTLRAYEVNEVDDTFAAWEEESDS